MQNIFVHAVFQNGYLSLLPQFFLENNKMEQTYTGSAPLLTPLLCSLTRSYHYNLHYIIIRLVLKVISGVLTV